MGQTGIVLDKNHWVAGIVQPGPRADLSASASGIFPPKLPPTDRHPTLPQTGNSQRLPSLEAVGTTVKIV